MHFSHEPSNSAHKQLSISTPLVEWLPTVAPNLFTCLTETNSDPALAYLLCQVLSHYTEQQSGIPLEPFENLTEKKNGEIPGLTIVNPKARVFVGEGASFTKTVVSGSGEALLFFGKDSVLSGCDIACHGKKNIFVSGFNCRLEGLFTHMYGSLGTTILCPGVTSQAGCNFCVQENSFILVGSDCMLSTHVFMRTSDSHGIYDKASLSRINSARPIILHPHVWISRASTLNKGTEIGEGTVLGQGAVANGPLKSSCIYAGAPAIIARENIAWDRRTAASLSDSHNFTASHFLSSFKDNVRLIHDSIPMDGALLSKTSYALASTQNRLGVIQPTTDADCVLYNEIAKLLSEVLTASSRAKSRLKIPATDSLTSQARVDINPEKEHRPLVACLMMQKDESALLEAWIEYHAHLFGLENLYVWDNGSSDEKVLRTLSEYKNKGLNVDYKHNTEIDFRRKGIILGNKIKELDSTGKYDFFFPIDCDEFLALKVDSNMVTSNRSQIQAALKSLLNESQALGISSAFTNILGYPSYYWRWPHNKTFFRSGTFGEMDHGYHQGKSCLAEGKKETDFTYMHYHHKPYAMIVEHSKNKLRPYMNIEDKEEMNKVYHTNRLVKFIMDGEENYLKKFTLDGSLFIPEFHKYIQNNNLPLPLDEG